MPADMELLTPERLEGMASVIENPALTMKPADWRAAAAVLRAVANYSRMKTTALQEILDKGFTELPYSAVNAYNMVLYEDARAELKELVTAASAAYYAVEQNKKNLAAALAAQDELADCRQSLAEAEQNAERLAQEYVRRNHLTVRRQQASVDLFLRAGAPVSYGPTLVAAVLALLSESARGGSDATA